MNTVARTKLSVSLAAPAGATLRSRTRKNSSSGARRSRACSAPFQRRAMASLGMIRAISGNMTRNRNPECDSWHAGFNLCHGFVTLLGKFLKSRLRASLAAHGEEKLLLCLLANRRREIPASKFSLRQLFLTDQWMGCACTSLRGMLDAEPGQSR